MRRQGSLILATAAAVAASIGATTMPTTAPTTSTAAVPAAVPASMPASMPTSMPTMVAAPTLPAAPPAAAAGPGYAKRLYEAVTPSLVAVQYTYTGEVQQQDVIVAGVVVDDRGLVMIPLIVVGD